MPNPLKLSIIVLSVGAALTAPVSAVPIVFGLVGSAASAYALQPTTLSTPAPSAKASAFMFSPEALQKVTWNGMSEAEKIQKTLTKLAPEQRALLIQPHIRISIAEGEWMNLQSPKGSKGWEVSLPKSSQKSQEALSEALSNVYKLIIDHEGKKKCIFLDSDGKTKACLSESPTL